MPTETTGVELKIMQTVYLDEKEARIDEVVLENERLIVKDKVGCRLPGYVSWGLALIGPFVSIIGLLALSSVLSPTSQWAYLPLAIVLLFVLAWTAIEKRNPKIWWFAGLFCALNLFFFTFTCGVLSATVSKAFSSVH